jgi:hypothetical protein
MTKIKRSSLASLPSMYPPWLTGPWGMAAAGCILSVLWYLAWTYYHWGGEDNVILISNVAMLPPMLLAALAAWRVTAQPALPRRVRWAWFLIGLSIFTNWIGNAVWTYLESLLRVQPFPSVADIFYLASYPLLLWGLLTLSATHKQWREQRVFWFDLLITLTTASMYVGYFLILPTATINNSDFLTQLLATAYPVWGLILLAAVLGLLLRKLASSNIRSVLLLLLLGISFFLLSDLSYGYASLAGTYVGGGWIDTGWQVSQVFMVLAALRQLYHGPISDSTERWHMVLDRLTHRIPLLSILLGYGLVFYVLITGINEAAAGLLIGALLLTAFVIGQQIVSPAFVNLPIRAKVILTFVLVSVLSASLVTLISYLTIRTNLQSAVGRDLKARARDRAGAVGSLLSKQSDALEGFVLSEVLESWAVASNAGYGSSSLPEIWSQLRQQELAWQYAPDSDQLVQHVLNNEAAM